VLAVVHDNQQLRVRKLREQRVFRRQPTWQSNGQGSRELLWHEMRVTLRRQLDDCGARANGSQQPPEPIGSSDAAHAGERDESVALQRRSTSASSRSRPTKLVNSAVAGPALARRRRPTWSVAAGAGGRRQRGVLVVVKLERGGELPHR